MKRLEGYASCRDTCEMLEVWPSRQTVYRWEMLLGANLLLATRDFYDASDAHVRALHHSDDINSVGFNHDGTKIVSCSDDKTIKVWGAGVTPDTIKSTPNQ